MIHGDFLAVDHMAKNHEDSRESPDMTLNTTVQKRKEEEGGCEVEYEQQVKNHRTPVYFVKKSHF